ncbi:unnamed protein product [Rotaria sordida]|uniref:Transposase n=1 Tax=Rotaria sordida TaxID=392033 RepID=A0A820A5Y6_9BILA|nr:unnamed protein product [Rotaria sordida]
MMIHDDNMDETKVRQLIEKKECVLIINSKDLSKAWNEIRLIAHKSTPTIPFIGWVACFYCSRPFRSHSAADVNGKRRNYGLTSALKHLDQCSSRKKEMAAKRKRQLNDENENDNNPNQSQQSSSSPTVNKTLSKFLYNKSILPKTWQNRIKEAECKYVVAGMHSFRSVEHDGLLQLAQTCVDIGATFGRVNVENIWYGRQSIRNECELKFHQYREDIKSIIQPYINDRTVSATVDLWRDDIIQRYYLDFTIFYMTEHWQLKHSILRCKYFDEQSKSAINIWSEIESIFDEFHLVIGDTPITTDEGANIKDSLKNEIRCPCMAHRCSTTLECAWDKTNQLSFDFRCLTGSVSELRSFVARSGGLQAKLPKTVKKDSCTRPWRSYYIVYESVYSSYDSLIKLLEPMFEENKILSINQNLLKNIVDLMKRFSGIFDQLEFCNQPTLQNVVPSYYAMVDFVRLNSHDRPEIKILKEQIQIALESKYWTSIMQIHWIATFLDPSFRDLSFVNDKSYRLKQIKCIENGLYSMADDLKLEDVRKDNNTSESSKNERISGFDDHDI